MLPNLELTTAHWEWRDGENSVYSPEVGLESLPGVRVPSGLESRIVRCTVFSGGVGLVPDLGNS